jgi:hypothetical protein
MPDHHSAISHQGSLLMSLASQDLVNHHFAIQNCNLKHATPYGEAEVPVLRRVVLSF